MVSPVDLLKLVRERDEPRRPSYKNLRTPRNLKKGRRPHEVDGTVGLGQRKDVKPTANVGTVEPQAYDVGGRKNIAKTLKLNHPKPKKVEEAGTARARRRYGRGNNTNTMSAADDSDLQNQPTAAGFAESQGDLNENARVRAVGSAAIAPTTGSLFGEKRRREPVEEDDYDWNRLDHKLYKSGWIERHQGWYQKPDFPGIMLTVRDDQIIVPGPGRRDRFRGNWQQFQQWLRNKFGGGVRYRAFESLNEDESRRVFNRIRQDHPGWISRIKKLLRQDGVRSKEDLRQRVQSDPDWQAAYRGFVQMLQSPGPMESEIPLRQRVGQKIKSVVQSPSFWLFAALIFEIAGAMHMHESHFQVRSGRGTYSGKVVRLLDPQEYERAVLRGRREKGFYPTPARDRWVPVELPGGGVTTLPRNRLIPMRESSRDGYIEDAIIDAMARAMFVSAWADQQEEAGVRLSGKGDLMDQAPETPAGVIRRAEALAKQIEQMNGKSLEQLWEEAGRADGREADPETFGHYLGMQSIGHGVSWFDDHERFPLKLPQIEFTHYDLDGLTESVDWAHGRGSPDRPSFARQGDVARATNVRQDVPYGQDAKTDVGKPKLNQEFAQARSVRVERLKESAERLRRFLGQDIRLNVFEDDDWPEMPEFLRRKPKDKVKKEEEPEEEQPYRDDPKKADLGEAIDRHQQAEWAYKDMCVLARDAVDAMVRMHGPELFGDAGLMADRLSDMIYRIRSHLDREGQLYFEDHEIEQEVKKCLKQSERRLSQIDRPRPLPKAAERRTTMQSMLEAARFTYAGGPRGGLVTYRHSSRLDERIAVRLDPRSGRPTGWYHERGGKKIATGRPEQLAGYVNRLG